jgi:protease-4
MDEQPLSSQPAAASAENAHPAGNRRVKRRLAFALMGLYAASLLAASFLILRRPEPSAKPPDKRSLLALSQPKDAVGWVSIHGPIYASAGGRPWEKGADQWSRRIRSLAETGDVKAIVLDINSPGGSVGAVQELYSQILRVRKEKKIPVVALFGDVAASGGYYIAAACDKIVAHPGTLTGSIGVIFSVGNLEGLFSKVGYRVEPIKSGPHKDIGSPARPMTPEERKILQELIDDAYGQFVSAVGSGRGLDEQKVRALADGRIYSGRQALDAGLVDVLGDSTDAVDLAAKLAKIPGKPKIKRDVEKFSDLFDLLESRLRSVLGGESSLARLAETLRPYEGLEYRWSALRP